MTDDLAAAVARLRDYADHCITQRATDTRAVLAALEAAQADARRGLELARAVDASFRCEHCGRGPSRRVRYALAALDEAQANARPAPSAEPPAQAATDDLVGRLRYLGIFEDNGSGSSKLMRAAADTIERLRAERDYMKRQRDRHIGSVRSMEHVQRGLIDRAERAEAERDVERAERMEQARLLGMSGSREAALIAELDTLAAIVRAADAMHLNPTMDNINAWLEARAKWEGK